jgi:hypothetical protein
MWFCCVCQSCLKAHAHITEPGWTRNEIVRMFWLYIYIYIYGFITRPFQICLKIMKRCLDSSVSIVTRLKVYVSGTWVRFSAGAKYSFFSTASKPTLGPTRSPIQWLFLRDWSGCSVKLTLCYYLVPRLRMRGAISPFSICHHGVMLN